MTLRAMSTDSEVSEAREIITDLCRLLDQVSPDLIHEAPARARR